MRGWVPETDAELGPALVCGRGGLAESHERSVRPGRANAWQNRCWVRRGISECRRSQAPTSRARNAGRPRLT